MKRCYICGKINNHKICSPKCMRVEVMRQRIRKFKENILFWIIGVVWMGLCVYGLSLLP